MPLSSVLGAQSLVRPGVCTSTTRPASPFAGQTIYETDTNLVKSYNGSSWITIGPTTVPTAAVTAIDSAQVTTYQGTSSTSYTDLTTAGPSVTLTTGTSAIVMFGCRYNDDLNNGNSGYMSFAVSGATTIAASDTFSTFGDGAAYGGNSDKPDNYHYKVTTLTAGSNTFTAKYKKAGGTSNASFGYRYITVIAL